MSKSQGTTIRVLPAIAEANRAAWDACAISDAHRLNPFLTHAFLKALEDSNTVGGRTGWVPQHLVLDDGNGGIAAACPAYLKFHSQGEYVFDHGWADAYERAGGSYYPKLQIAVPFTPVPGPRLLARPGPDRERNRRLLALGAIELARRRSLSSVHLTYLAEDEWRQLGTDGFLLRTGKQYHWHNQGYADFDDFLAALASRKRKAIRRERAHALPDGASVEWLTGTDITEAHWDAFFAFYMETGSRKWGRPYLNRRFFSLLGSAMADRCLLVMVRCGGRYIAGALNLIGGDCLYGRYWGAIEHHPFLHFEVCYYQAIEFAIRHRLPRVEAGAQGDHKLARGYVPVATYSAHWIADRAFARAVERFLDEERREMEEVRTELAAAAPYRQQGARTCAPYRDGDAP
ncbi:MAG TPA: GNAT family N-acetyltransferase [Hyphomicrobiaceae bacterium]|nr:GNAT family N-acetyltransferase [Hyphomicrobiaceae bacterium]